MLGQRAGGWILARGQEGVTRVAIERETSEDDLDLGVLVCCVFQAIWYRRHRRGDASFRGRKAPVRESRRTRQRRQRLMLML